MTGILLVILTLVWFSFSLKLTLLITARFRNSLIRWAGGLLTFAILLPLPIADEIVGQWQFDALCRKNTKLIVNEEVIKGRAIRLAFNPSNAPVAGIAMPVMYTRVLFQDAITEKHLGEYGRYIAKGGLLVRTIGISESDSPLWMSRHYCAPAEGSQEIARRLDFQIIN